MEVLSSVKDARDKPARMTLNCCVANPDFSKIRESGFQEYFYEPFTETLKRYPHHDRSFDLWLEGMAHGVFRPQFHGREHLNFQKWLRWLKAGVECFRRAFDEECYCAGVPQADMVDSCLEAYKIESAEECGGVRQSLREGLALFEQLFGYRSLSMIAPCYIWDDYIEAEAATQGVKSFQGGYVQKHSTWQRGLGNRITGHFFGEKNVHGQCYTVRNCSFEPSQLASDNAEHCLAGIRRAFAWHLPAVVSCHRLNFIGELQVANRDRNLREFRRMLKMLVGEFPDVEFLSSDELGEIYLEKQRKQGK